MQNNLENEINQELKREKFFNFYSKNKNKILFFILFFIILIIGYQYRIFYNNKENSRNIEKILLSKIYFDENNEKALDLLKNAKDSKNDKIIILSSNQLIDYYLKKGDENHILEEINFLRGKLKNRRYDMELLNIKEAIIKFDTIQEKEILKLLQISNKDYFSRTKKKLLYEFYIKTNQINKANQFIVK